MVRIFSSDRAAKGRATRARRSSARISCESLETRNLLSTYAGDNLQLNEGLTAPFGSSINNRYFEISGTPGATIGNTELIVVDGFNSGSPKGQITYALNLKGDKIGTDGLLEIQGVNGPGRYNATTTVIKDPNFTSAVSTGGTHFIALLNYTNTSGSTAVPNLTVLDPLNTGVLDFTAAGPAHGAFVDDAFAFVFDSTPDAADVSYGVKENVPTSVGTTITVTAPNTDFGLLEGTITPDGATRESAGTYLTTNAPPASGSTATVNFTPGNFWTYGFVNSGTFTYQVGTPNVVHLATGSTITNPALTPGGLNNIAVAAFDPANVYTVTEGGSLSIKVDLVNGTTTTNAGTPSVQYKAVDITATQSGTTPNYSVAPAQNTPQSFTSGVFTITVTTTNRSDSSDLFFALALTGGNVYLAVPQVEVIDIQA